MELADSHHTRGSGDGHQKIVSPAMNHTNVWTTLTASLSWAATPATSVATIENVSTPIFYATLMNIVMKFTGLNLEIIIVGLIISAELENYT